jgi:hypothetical protein
MLGRPKNKSNQRARYTASAHAQPVNIVSGVKSSVEWGHRVFSHVAASAAGGVPFAFGNDLWASVAVLVGDATVAVSKNAYM